MVIKLANENEWGYAKNAGRIRKPGVPAIQGRRKIGRRTPEEIYRQELRSHRENN